MFFERIGADGQFLADHRIFLSLHQISKDRILPPRQSILFHGLRYRKLFSFLPCPSLMLFHPIGQMVFEHIENKNIA